MSKLSQQTRYSYRNSFHLSTAGVLTHGGGSAFTRVSDTQWWKPFCRVTRPFVGHIPLSGCVVLHNGSPASHYRQNCCVWLPAWHPIFISVKPHRLRPHSKTLNLLSAKWSVTDEQTGGRAVQTTHSSCVATWSTFTCRYRRTNGGRQNIYVSYRSFFSTPPPWNVTVSSVE